MFPQNFNDYESVDGKVAMDKFITGIQADLPGHLHRYSIIAEAFDDADVNGKYTVKPHHEQTCLRWLLGRLARSDAPPPGMWTVAGSILRSSTFDRGDWL